LAWVHPKGARLFYSFAAGVALQRVCTDAHYLSDVLAGAVVGLLWGHACFGRGVLARRFDAMEAWWSRRFGWVLPAGHARLDEADSEPDLVALPTPGERTPAPIRRAA